MERILVVNCGSSSLKFKLYDVTCRTLAPVVGGLIERIGDPANSNIIIKKAHGKPEYIQAPLQSISAGLEHAFHTLTKHLSPSVREEVHAVGHRIVHGGGLSSSVVMDAPSIAEVQRAAVFAPLHNVHQLRGVNECGLFFPGKRQVGVFDTAFHQTVPQPAHVYALPYELYSEKRVQRYGMHGTSYRYLVSKASQLLQIPRPDINLVLAHIGSGSSMCCVKQGMSIDTTMGMTPLEGLVMGTRCGDVDPGIVSFFGAMGMSAGEMDNLMNKQSGLKGLCGHSDMRNIERGVLQGDSKCKLAFEVFVHRIRKYLGAYLLQLSGSCDALVFSAGIGENSAMTRSAVCRGLEAFGIEIDESLNEAAVGGKTAVVSMPTSRVKIIVIPTDEELCIAQDAALLSGVDIEEAGR